jgi:quercetin dioxygenase-like cupin family protein
MRYVFSTADTTVYRFPTHVNELVLDRSEATVTEVFVVDLEPGEAPPLHIHPDTEQIFYMLQGEGELRVGDEGRDSYRVKPGDVVRIPPATWHRIINDGAIDIRYVSIDAFPGARPTDEPTWDDHVKGICAAQGWDYATVKRPRAAAPVSEDA